MKLSDIVARLNLLDSLDVASECDIALGKLSHITHVITENTSHHPTAGEDVARTFDKLSHVIGKYASQVESLRQDLRSEIEQKEQEYLQNSLHVYREEMIHDTVDTILNRRMRINDDDDIVLRTRLKNLTDWRVPGMILRPGHETYIEDMVPLDPLYVVDHDSELMRPAISKFTPEYQRRLCEYVINDWSDGPVLAQLPDGQFGAIFAYHYFNHKPVPVICKFLSEFYQKLRPGGSVLMTYNNCDLAHGVIRAEHFWMLYTPRRLIEKHACAMGFELVDAYDGKGDVSWLEFRKPGDITSLRGGQTLAKVLVKED
jgi:hypothetical protein